MRETPPRLDVDDVALFLDVDGTLLELQLHPGDVTAEPALIRLLDAVSSTVGGAMALVSGRSLDDVDRIFTPQRFPVAGAHGAELRIPGANDADRGEHAMPEDMLQRLADFVDANDGLLLERKHGGASLHYRRAPELEPDCRALVDDILSALGPDFRLIAGKMVFEIAPSAHSKGEAVRTFLEHPPFSERRPVFVGDDVTDEDGFRAANSLGGVSILVGHRDNSAADFQLDDVPAVHRWLQSMTTQQEKNE